MVVSLCLYMENIIFTDLGLRGTSVAYLPVGLRGALFASGFSGEDNYDQGMVSQQEERAATPVD